MRTCLSREFAFLGREAHAPRTSGAPHGITEDVITALGRFSNLLVIAKSASFPFKGSNTPPAEIGRLLDARYLLEGSVRRAGDRVRVNVELTEAATARQVCASISWV